MNENIKWNNYEKRLFNPISLKVGDVNIPNMHINEHGEIYIESKEYLTIEYVENLLKMMKQIRDNNVGI